MAIRFRNVFLLLLCAIPLVVASTYFMAAQQEQRTAERRKTEETARKEALIAAAQKIKQAASEHMRTHSDRFPNAAIWEAQLRPYLPKGASFALRAPTGKPPRRWAMNQALSGRSIEEVDGADYGLSRRILFFESVAQAASASDNLETLPPPDSVTGFVIVYADLRAEYVPAERREDTLLSAKR